MSAALADVAMQRDETEDERARNVARKGWASVDPASYPAGFSRDPARFDLAYQLAEADLPVAPIVVASLTDEAAQLVSVWCDAKLGGDDARAAEMELEPLGGCIRWFRRLVDSALQLAEPTAHPHELRRAMLRTHGGWAWVPVLHRFDENGQPVRVRGARMLKQRHRLRWFYTCTWDRATRHAWPLDEAGRVRRAFDYWTTWEVGEPHPPADSPVFEVWMWEPSYASQGMGCVQSCAEVQYNPWGAIWRREDMEGRTPYRTYDPNGSRRLFGPYLGRFNQLGR